MKFAPLLAVGSLGLMVLAMATAKSPNPADIERPIDAAGVRTLEVRSDNSVEITIAAGKPHVTYPDSTTTEVRTRRDGDRFLIDVRTEGWQTIKVEVPPTVERFVVEQGSIGTKLKVGEIEILSPEDVSWRGDARRVVLRDTSDPSKHRKDGDEESDEDCGCSGHSTLTVAGGEIGEVRAYSPHATLRLSDVDKIGVVYAWLGPKGDVTIDTARNFHQVHVLKEGEAAPAPAPAPLQVSP